MMRILVTGATGYIGGRLVPLLLEAGHAVRVAVRDPERLSHLQWVNQVEIIEADLNSANDFGSMFDDIDIAYYLVHSMGSGGDFHERDLAMADLFAQKAHDARVKRVIYLSALGHESSGLTEHLRSRQETGRHLAAFGGDVIELRAGPVIGAGSLPFEMIRYLTERVPVMVCPRWVFTKVQPIGLSDVLSYLVDSIALSGHEHQVIEIGGSEIVSYGQMMTRYAHVRKLRRVMIRVPVLTPRLSSLWVHLITPLRGSFARPIVEGLRNEVVVHDPQALRLFPQIAPTGYEDAVRSALMDLRPGKTSPMSPSSTPTETLSIETTNTCGMIRESRSISVTAPPDAVFDAFSSLGGQQGWYMNWGWRIRGALDRLIGGPGLRRTRPSGDINKGDSIDFWAVEEITSGQQLLLRAEMKLPGAAWLEFSAVPSGAGNTVLIQTTYFAPKGLAGVIYWHVLLPIHKMIFNGLIKRIAQIARNDGHQHSTLS